MVGSEVVGVVPTFSSPHPPRQLRAGHAAWPSPPTQQLREDQTCAGPSRLLSLLSLSKESASLDLN